MIPVSAWESLLKLFLILLPKEIKSHYSNNRFKCCTAIPSWALEDGLPWSLVPLLPTPCPCVRVIHHISCWLQYHYTPPCLAIKHHHKETVPAHVAVIFLLFKMEYFYVYFHFHNRKRLKQVSEPIREREPSTMQLFWEHPSLHMYPNAFCASCGFLCTPPAPSVPLNSYQPSDYSPKGQGVCSGW